MNRLLWRRRALKQIAAYLDEWEASYGLGERELPAHWGIKDRIDTLRRLIQKPIPR